VFSLTTVSKFGFIRSHLALLFLAYILIKTIENQKGSINAEFSTPTLKKQTARLKAALRL